LPSHNRLCEVPGLASRTPDAMWVPTAHFFERPLAGFRVPAGAPETAGDGGVEVFAVDAYLIPKPSHTTLVPVKGDSMIDVGIFPGDDTLQLLRAA
jgi:repressor LexA